LILGLIGTLAELIVGGIGRLLGALGFEKFVERDEAKPDPRNFPPPR
jgi:hypothetical protein